MINQVLEYSIIIFATQLIFIGCRTWNVMAIAENKTIQVLVSGAIVHITWLIGIAIGSVSMYKIINNFQWLYIPIVLCSLTGGLVGSYITMKFKNKSL